MALNQFNLLLQTRRHFFGQCALALGSMALTSLLSESKAAAPAVNPLAPKKSHFPGKAKSVIYLFMYGGPSHVDTFDYKPKLYPLDGKTITVKTFGRGGKKNEGRVVGPKWAFRQYGECGKRISDLFPNLGGCVDDIAFLHS